MATSPGQRFVRRHDAARSTTSNTTAADVTYDTVVLSEGGYSWADPEVTVDESGLYLAVFDIGQADLASTRAVGTLVPSINTVDQARFRATHRYLRNSGGTEGASIGMAILDLTANDDVKVRNPGALSPPDAVGNYGTRSGAGGGLQLIRLPAGNLTHLERTVDAAEVGTSNINTTRPWLDASGTWTTITYDSEVIDDGGLYPGSGGDVTLAANKKYMVVWGATIYSTDSSRHTHVVRLQVDGNNVQSGSGYQRNTSSQGPPICGMYLHETGGSAETLRLQATHETEGGDAGTPQVADAYLQVIELPDSAEWIHADNGATDSLTTALAGSTTWYDTPLSSTLRADGGSNLSLDAANNAIQNDSGGTLPVLAIGWHRWDRDSTASGTRKMPWSRWDNGGVSVNYGVAGAYSRGQQSTDDTWQAHYCSAATMDLADAADLSFQANEPASSANSDMGIYASTSRFFLGVQVLNLESLVASSPTEDNLLADDVEVTVELSSPALGQVHGLLANDIESVTELTAPGLASAEALNANDIESVTSVSAPALAQTHALTAVQTESNSELTTPDIGQAHTLAADDVSSLTELTTPAAGIGGHVLLADDVESDAEVSSPSVGQVHGLFAVDVQAAAEVSLPALGEPLTVTVSQRHTISLTEIRQTSSPVDLRASTSKPVTRKTQSAVIRRHSVSPADDNRSVS